MAELKEAKRRLDVDFQVLPCKAYPGGPTRVLAVGIQPDFLCDFALVKDPANSIALEAGLAWVLDPDKEDSRASLIIDQLRATFGADVTELAPWDSDWAPDADY